MICRLSGAEKSWIALPERITGYFRDLYSGLRLTEESANSNYSFYSSFNCK